MPQNRRETGGPWLGGTTSPDARFMSKPAEPYTKAEAARLTRFDRARVRATAGALHAAELLIPELARLAGPAACDALLKTFEDELERRAGLGRRKQAKR